jgi:hypothetical protein
MMTDQRFRTLVTEAYTRYHEAVAAWERVEWVNRDQTGAKDRQEVTDAHERMRAAQAGLLAMIGTATDIDPLPRVLEIIRAHGHYIMGSNKGPDSLACCMKCGVEFGVGPLHPWRATVFRKPCKGNWEKEGAAISEIYKQAEERQARLLECLSIDARAERKEKTGRAAGVTLKGPRKQKGS